ncbi:MAG TPA: hypothetical protein VFV23_04880 [Verrucomicrobiae bacterium]|nr:hypothetical protein [Verrucomicrobiae bacterium]
MKLKIFAAFAGAVVAISAFTGCVSTVTDSNSFGVPFVQDDVEGKYNRTVQQVYAAAVTVVKRNGTINTEYIPHYTTNTVVALSGRVNQQNVWVRVTAIDPNKPITQIIVQARTKGGLADVDLAHELEKEVALELAR